MLTIAPEPKTEPKAASQGNVSVRYYCTNDTTHRVYPYDTCEIVARVLAPEPGASGNDVLLGSYNNRRRERGEPAVAWCWSCDQWVACKRETRAEYVLRYLRRQSVRMRLQGSERTITRKLQRRTGRNGR